MPETPEITTAHSRQAFDAATLSSDGNYSSQGLKANLSPDAIQPTGLLRLPAILGDKTASPPVPPLVPVAKSTWWQWIKKGIAPAPIRIGPRAVAWRKEDIALFMAGNFLANR